MVFCILDTHTLTKSIHFSLLLLLLLYSSEIKRSKQLFRRVMWNSVSTMQGEPKGLLHRYH